MSARRPTKAEKQLADLVREFQTHDQRRYGAWTRGMHDRANVALAPFGYPPVDRPPVLAPPRTHTHVVAENFCNECGR